MQRLIRAGALILLGVATSQAAAQAVPTPADSSLLALVHRLVVDSVRGGGFQDGQRYVAGDSVSFVFLRGAGIAVDSTRTPQPTCPGSTTSAGAPMAPPVGYRVYISVKPAADTTNRVLAVSKSCAFIHNGTAGRMRGFGESVAWEIQRNENAWRIVRTLSHVIT